MGHEKENMLNGLTPRFLKIGAITYVQIPYKLTMRVYGERERRDFISVFTDCLVKAGYIESLPGFESASHSFGCPILAM